MIYKHLHITYIYVYICIYITYIVDVMQLVKFV